MIARLIAWSARNLLLVLFGTGFAAAAGLYALTHLPLDAIPDLSDTQVIVYTEYPGQAPQVIEDQVTYPLTTAMLTVPKSKVVRGFSFFGVSFVYVIFEDGTDIYWARSRVLEFLNGAASRLPAGVAPTIGPDATGVGWVYQYAVMSKELNLSDTRAIQDWNLKFALAKAEGVAEVASVGGFVKQYNVVLDPQRMRDLGITVQKMRDAIRASNADVGGRTVELSEFEYVIRGKGYIKSINDLGNIVLKTNNGTPVLLRDVARVELGLPITLTPIGVRMPVDSMSMRALIGMVQALETPGNCSALSISAIRLSMVMPDRHCSFGLRLTTVSNISDGAGSVAVAARPALP